MELDKIKLNPNNPRFIKDEKFKSLVKSLVELPVMTNLREIVVDEENVIIGGNMRFRAAKEAGWKEIPTKVFTREMADENNKLTNQNKTYEQYCKEIMIKDNISGGEWDWELLSSQFEKEELEDWGMDVDKWVDDEVVEDEVPEVTDNPVSQLGEVYQLGRHRLMCGDSTKIEDVEKLMDGNKADMVFTDPPYNVGLKYEEYKDNKTNEEYKQFISDYVGNGLAFAPTLVITPGKSNEHYYYNLFEIKDSMVWYKKFGTSRGSLYKAMVTEPILFIGEKPLNKNFATDILEYMTDRIEGLVHACPKPIKLIAEIITTLTDDKSKVLDLFLGSGSTLIACEQTNRICYGMEIDPKYIDVIRKRYAKFINSEDWESATPKIL